MRKMVMAAVAASVLMLGACNTVRGAGQDVQSAGQAVEDAVD